MGKVSSYPPGTFCWVDLGTPDVAGAKAFYGGLFGWDTEDVPAAGGSYTMCRLQGEDVCGIHRHGEDQGTGWDSSICVENVDAAASRARDLGATVLVEPFELEGVARTAVLRDPTGAVVSLWQPAGYAGARLVNEIGAWIWNELVSPDLDAAKAFYGGLFGWSAQDAPGPLARAGFRLGGLLVGGVHGPTPEEGDTPRWTVAFRAADADESVALARRLGGSVLLPPMATPAGSLAIVSDPAGASFSVTANPAAPWHGVDGS